MMTNRATYRHTDSGRPYPRIESPFYPLTWVQAQQDYQAGLLTPKGLVHAYFYTHLRPGQTMLVVAAELCQQLGISTATYYRVISALHQAGRLSVCGRMSIGLPARPGQLTRRATQAPDSQLQESKSQLQEDKFQARESNSQSRESSQAGKASEGRATLVCEKTPTNKETLSLNNKTVPISPPVTVQLDGDRRSLSPPDNALEALQGFCGQIQASGIMPNPAIQQRLATLLETTGSTTAAQIVTNAIAAFEEQQARGLIRNPGGFFNAALQRQFTTNQPPLPPAAAAHPQSRQAAPNVHQIVLAVDLALMQGDRAFARQKLQDLWECGWQEPLQELLQLRPDWGLRLTAQGIEAVSLL